MRTSKIRVPVSQRFTLTKASSGRVDCEMCTVARVVASRPIEAACMGRGECQFLPGRCFPGQGGTDGRYGRPESLDSPVRRQIRAIPNFSGECLATPASYRSQLVTERERLA